MFSVNVLTQHKAQNSNMNFPKLLGLLFNGELVLFDYIYMHVYPLL